jgi:long-chain acyl-CoA synthetase
MASADTIPRRFLTMLAEHGDIIALADPMGEGEAQTYRQFADSIARAAAGLAGLGVERGSRVVLMMRNRAEFHVADAAALFLGATPFSVYNTASPEEIAYAVTSTEATVAIVENGTFHDRFRAARDAAPRLRMVLVESDAALPTGATRWADIMTAPPADLAQLAAEGDPDDIATVIFTSGTTGPPKAVAVTHANVCAAGDAVCERAGVGDFAGFRLISYLPMAHIAERLTSHYAALLFATSVAPCDDLLRFRDFTLAFRPNIVFGVPRVWEKLQAAVLAAASADPGRAKALDDGINAAVELVLQQRSGPLSDEQRETWDFLDAVAFSTVRELTGLSDVVLAVTGAAPISPALIDWFHAIRVPLSEIYGMSESTGVITWDPAERKPGAVGTALPGVDVRIAEDGEVLARGANVFPGYLNAPEASAETLADGWLHTGDIGELDDDGYLRIVDRKKELIITAGGENVSPANLEAALATIPLVGQACVVGDRQKFPAAIITLDADYLPVWAAAHGRDGATRDELVADPDLLAEIDRAVADVNRRFTRAYQIKRFVVVPDEWLPNSEVLTPTFKLKRRGISTRYAEEIASMYAL